LEISSKFNLNADGLKEISFQFTQDSLWHVPLAQHLQKNHYNPHAPHIFKMSGKTTFC